MVSKDYQPRKETKGGWWQNESQSPQTPLTRKATEGEREAGNWRENEASAHYYCKCLRPKPRDTTVWGASTVSVEVKKVTQEQRHVKEKSAFLRGERGEASMSPSFFFFFPFLPLLASSDQREQNDK